VRIADGAGSLLEERPEALVDADEIQSVVDTCDEQSEQISDRPLALAAF
jgi:hypothetical protein